MMHFIHRCLRCRWDSRIRCMEERMEVRMEERMEERMEGRWGVGVGIRWFHCHHRGRDKGCYIPRFQTWIWMW